LVIFASGNGPIYWQPNSFIRNNKKRINFIYKKEGRTNKYVRIFVIIVLDRFKLMANEDAFTNGIAKRFCTPIV
jgi:hypothetical protein